MPVLSFVLSKQWLINLMVNRMAPRNKDDWSDSDEDDALSEVETTVLLGIPDGPIGTPGDLADVAVSRIGGRPVRSRVP
jgi:hypothetical protein